MQGGCSVLLAGVYALNLPSVYSVVFPTVRIHWSRNQGVGMGVALLTVCHRDPLAKILLLPGDNNNSIDLKMEIPSPPATFRSSCLSIGKKEITVVVGVIGPEY